MFLLFGGDEYYSGPGIADFRGRFATVEEAVEAARSKVFKNSWTRGETTCEWWQVVDDETLMIVRSCDEDDDWIESGVWGTEWVEELNEHTKARLDESRKNSSGSSMLKLDRDACIAIVFAVAAIAGLYVGLPLLIHALWPDLHGIWPITR